MNTLRKQPNYAAELTLPYLLDNPQALRYFDISGVSMMHLRRETFHLDLPGSASRFPHHYARELRKHLWAQDAGSRILKPAREFAQTPLAQEIMQEEGDYFSRSVSDVSHEGLISAHDLTKVLFIGRSTITGWQNKDFVNSVVRDGKYYFREEDVRSMCTWHYPEVLYVDPPLDEETPSVL